MKTVEFEGTVAPNGQIAIPPDVAREIPAGESVHVMVAWDGSDLDEAWRMAGRRRFEAAYAPEDAVYERLIDDAATR